MGSKTTVDNDYSHEIKRYFSMSSYCFSSSHVQMRELDHKEGWAEQFTFPNCGSRDSNQLILKEINSEYSLEGLTDVKTETPILWPPDTKSWFIGKDPDTEKEWLQE